ncbi:uncharacterized protein LOC143300724 isoform X2 [Babylonia areolata]
MTSLNEQEQQLLQTLLNQADVVSPPSDKPPQPEHSSSIDFNSSENDLHFWDTFINNGGEAMQFEQQTSATPFGGQQGRQQLQHTPETGQSATSGSSFQTQGSAKFDSQQTGFTGVATGQSMAGFQDQGHSFQQVQPNQTQSAQMTVSSSDNYQNQSSGFQQQFPVGDAMDQSGQLEKPGSLTCAFSSQSQGFSQQYSMDSLASGAQSEVGGHVSRPFQTQGTSFQPQTHTQFSDSSRHLQAQQQQVSQTSGGYLSSLPNSGKEQVSHSTTVFQNQNSDSQQQQQQQQTFLNEFTGNSGTKNSLQALVQAAGFHQQYASGGQSQPAQERRDSSQQQPMENFASQVASYQQQQQPPVQQQTLFQQGTQMNSTNNTEQNFHNSPAEGSSMCFSDGLSGFSPQTRQQEQQAAMAANTAVESPSSLQPVTGEGLQHMQYPNASPTKGQTDQDSAETFQGQVSHFSKQQSFHSPNGSPAQPVASPPSFPQPSPDPHNTYSQSAQTPGQGDQTVGLGFTGQTRGFPKQQSFSSPVPSPDKGAVEGSVPSSPANNYQHQSPAFSIQSPYSASGQPQGDQSSGNSFSPHTPGFSQALPSIGDQNVAASFQGSSAYSNNTIQKTPKSSSGFQTQDNLHSRCTVQNDAGVHSQNNAFQQTVFQPSTLPSQNNVTAQPMQEGSGPSSIEAEAVAFLVQESFQSVNQQNQSLESNNSAVPYQQIPSSQPAINTQRDQPMETQQSPYVVGSVSNTGTFQTPAPAQSPVFQETVTPVCQAGASFLNPALSFQAQPNTFQVSSSIPVQSLPLSMESLISGGALQSQNTEFSNNSIADSSFPGSSSGFNNQTVISSRPSASVSYTQTTTSVTGEQCVSSVTESNQFSQLPNSSSSFSQFASDTTPTFGRNNIQMQVQQPQVPHQQFPPPVNQQQTMQQTVFSSQAGGLTLVRNTSAHNLSSVVNDSVQISPFQPVSSSVHTSTTHHTHPVTVFGNQQFEITQLHGQQSLPVAAPQQGTHNLSTVVPSLESSSVPNQLPFAQATPAPAPTVNSAACPVTQSSITAGKSPVASLQDSNQTNTALLMLSSVLQQIQSILPKTMGQQKESGLTPTQSETGVRTENPEVLAQLLQSQSNASQILQLLQQQQQNAQSQAVDSGSQQVPSQTSPFDQQQKQPVNASVMQQPNFLVQPSNQQQLITQQQQQPQQQQQNKESLQNPNKQLAAQIPASMVTSLAGSLSSHGPITVGSDGQLMIGNQSFKLLLDSSSGPASVNLVPTSTAVTSAAAVSLPSLTPALAGVGGLAQTVPVSLFSAGAVSCASVGNMTHTINTTPTAVPHAGSNISKSTTVVPTSSFTQPLSVAGVGMGLSVSSMSSSTVPSEDGAVPVPSSKPQSVMAPPVQSAAVGGTNTVNTPPIANIFYPVSSASRLEKRMDTSVSNVSAPVTVGNFLNVTTGSASMLLNAFSMAVADGKQDGSGFKVGGFSVQEVTSSGTAFTEFGQQNTEVVQSDAADMEIVEVVDSASPEKPMETDKPVSNLTPRHSSRKTSIDEELESKEENTPGSVLRRILTMKDEEGNAPNSKAGSPTPGNSPTETPTELFVDGNTQATLIEKSEKLRLSSEAPQEDDMQQTDFWTSVPSFVSASVEDYVPSKVHRGADDLDASSKHVDLPSVEKLFDAGGATSNSAFVFTKFGSEESGVRTFGSAPSDPPTTTSPCATEERMSGIMSSVKSTELLKLGHVPTASIRPNSRRQKDPSLTIQFPSKVGDYELRILAQPEEQHRARYLTEGSRGAVKDKSQQGYPHVKLIGYNEPATLQVYIGSESGRLKPHGFYQACKVCGKNSTPCNEREIDGTNVIEIEISPLNDMQVYMDCVGILKLRNADVEKRIGTTKAKAKKKNSTKARLVFRCTLRKPDGGFVTLQVASTPILCTQPIGQPEISRLSLSELCVNQTNDLFVIGKNFLKGTQIIFREVGMDEKDLKWQSEAEIEVEYFQQTHLICRIPEYPNKDIKQPVHCQIVAFCGGKVSDPQDFTYKPAMVMVKVENEMDTEPCDAETTSKSLPFTVSPVALQLNRLVERTQHHLSSTAMFQLPPDTIPSMCMAPTLPTPTRVVSSTSAQPLPSILKPATLCLPASGQLTLGPSAVGGDGKGTLPVQFVLPSPGVGPAAAVTVDSRQLGNQPPQLVLMPNPPSSTVGSGGGVGGGVSSKTQPPVFTFTSLPSTTMTTPALNITGPSNSHSGARTTSAPMILFLAGPPTTATSSSATVSNTTAVPISIQQSMSNGQVESLLKQMLESSKSSSS